MPEMHDQVIDHASAWTSAEIGGKAGLSRRLGPEHLAAIDAAVRRTRGQAPDAVTRHDFGDPALVALMAGTKREIMEGRGAVVLCGLDIARYDLEDFQRLYWGLGTHLGDGATQSHRRDRIGFVQKEADNPTGRGYLKDTELNWHTDFHEVLSLASARKSEEGGFSGLVSSLALHNLMRETRPDLLPALYEGFHHVSVAGEVSPQKVPIFGVVDGRVSCYFHPPFIRNAAKMMGVELPPILAEAMAWLDTLAKRPDVSARFMLEPGEMVFWHNFTVLHSRTAFTDTAENRRLLLRLWLNVPQGRPMPPEFLARARYMDEAHDSGRAAIDYAREPA